MSRIEGRQEMVVQSNYKILKEQFYSDPNTLQNLINEAENWFCIETGISSSIIWNSDKFHTSDKKERIGYSASYSTSSNGTPWAKLVIHGFKDGGWTKSFDCKEARRELFEQWKTIRSNSSYTPPNRGSNPDNDKKKANNTKAQTRKEARKQQWKEENQAKAALTFKKSVSPTESKYLERKGLQQITSNVIRYYRHPENGYLVCKIFDIDGNLVGYQKIADKKVLDNGELKDKKIVYGSKMRGSFTPLTASGTLPDYNPKKIYIAESISTGCSGKEAIDLNYQHQPANKKGKKPPKPIVVCAYSANNIEHVAKALRKKYQKYSGKNKVKLVILADNDQHKVDQINKNTGLPVGNTGLIYAHRTAVKYNCLVCTPDFTGLDITNKPTDFNDLHQLAGIEEVVKQLSKPTKPDPYYAFFRDRQKEEKRIEKLFRRCEIIKIKEQYIPSTIADEIVSRKNQTDKITALLRSGIGTGKTTVVRTILDKYPDATVLFISPLISLNEQAAEKLNLESYTAVKESGKDVRTVKKLSCCLNSLPMLLVDNSLHTFDIVIIDEIEQVLSRFVGTLIDDKVTVFRCLEHLVKKANMFIAGDAYLSKISMNVLNKWRDNTKFIALCNQYLVGQDRTIVLHELAGSIQNTAINKGFSHRRKGVLFFNSKKMARQTHKLVNPIEHGSIYVSADNLGDDKVKELFKNPEKHILQYRSLVATPSINSGLSIKCPSIKFVGGAFVSMVNTACDTMQALGRIRDSKKIHCWIDERKNNLPTDPKIIVSKWTNTFKRDLGLMRFNEDDTLTIADPVFEQLVIDVTRSINMSKNNFYSHFLKLASLDGYLIEREELTEERKIECAKLQKDGKEMEAKEFIATRSSAMLLSKEEATEIDKLSHRTFEQTCALYKYELMQFYRLKEDASVEELVKKVEFDERGRIRTKVLELENTLFTDEQIREAYENQKKDKDGNIKERYVQDYKTFAHRREFFLALLTAVGINRQLEIKKEIRKREITLESGEVVVRCSVKPEPYEYKKTSESIQEFINWVTAQRDDIQGIINLPNNEYLQINPLQFIGIQLRKLNISQSGEEGCYSINTYSLDLMKEVLFNRDIIKGLSKPEPKNHQENIDEINTKQERNNKSDNEKPIHLAKRIITKCNRNVSGQEIDKLLIHLSNTHNSLNKTGKEIFSQVLPENVKEISADEVITDKNQHIASTSNNAAYTTPVIAPETPTLTIAQPFPETSRKVSEWLQLQVNKKPKKLIDDGWNLVVKASILETRHPHAPELIEVRNNLINFYQQNVVNR